LIVEYGFSKEEWMFYRVLVSESDITANRSGVDNQKSYLPSSAKRASRVSIKTSASLLLVDYKYTTPNFSLNLQDESHHQTVECRCSMAMGYA